MYGRRASRSITVSFLPRFVESRDDGDDFVTIVSCSFGYASFVLFDPACVALLLRLGQLAITAARAFSVIVIFVGFIVVVLIFDLAVNQVFLMAGAIIASTEFSASAVAGERFLV